MLAASVDDEQVSLRCIHYISESYGSARVSLTLQTRQKQSWLK